MHITRTRIIPLAATAAAALAIVAAPTAAAATLPTGATVTQSNGNAQIVATPGPAAQLRRSNSEATSRRSWANVRPAGR